MSFIEFLPPNPTKGLPHSVTLDKTALKADSFFIAETTTDTYFANSVNWKYILITMESSIGKETEVMIFDCDNIDQFVSTDFLISTKARDSWEVRTLAVFDFDGGYMRLSAREGQLNPTDFNFTTGPFVPPVVLNVYPSVHPFSNPLPNAAPAYIAGGSYGRDFELDQTVSNNMVLFPISSTINSPVASTMIRPFITKNLSQPGAPFMTDTEFNFIDNYDLAKDTIVEFTVTLATPPSVIIVGVPLPNPEFIATIGLWDDPPLTLPFAIPSTDTPFDVGINTITISSSLAAQYANFLEQFTLYLRWNDEAGYANPSEVHISNISLSQL